MAHPPPLLFSPPTSVALIQAEHPRRRFSLLNQAPSLRSRPGASTSPLYDCHLHSDAPRRDWSPPPPGESRSAAAMRTTTTENAGLRRLGRLPSPLSLRRHARPSGPSGGRSSLRPNAARGFLLCLGRNTAQAQAQCCGLEVAYRLLSKAQACAGVKYMPTASPSSSPPSSSPFPERRSLRPPRHHPRCAEPFLERRKTRKQKMVWWFSHGLDSFGRIEMQIRILLYRRNGVPVPVVDLPWNCSELHIKLLQNGWNGSLGHLMSGNHLMSLLWRLHTICLTSHSFQSYVILLENASPAYRGYDTNSHKIYITFSAQSREMCTAANVHWYFSHFGHVLSVNMRHERSYGFVRFRYPQTVRLLLSSWDPEVPHFILGAGVRVKRYNWNPAENHGLNGPNGGLEHMPNAPGELPGQVPDVPDEDAE